jgi:hypothetical protein
LDEREDLGGKDRLEKLVLDVFVFYNRWNAKCYRRCYKCKIGERKFIWLKKYFMRNNICAEKCFYNNRKYCYRSSRLN